eukprot:507317-Hanusia_phi.AAC.1
MLTIGTQDNLDAAISNFRKNGGSENIEVRGGEEGGGGGGYSLLECLQVHWKPFMIDPATAKVSFALLLLTVLMSRVGRRGVHGVQQEAMGKRRMDLQSARKKRKVRRTLWLLLNSRPPPPSPTLCPPSLDHH